MSAHENATPRPWRVGVGMGNLLPCVDASDGFGGTVEICEVWGVQINKVEDKGSRANAALIVEAVNAYDTLRAENERLAEFARWVIAESVFSGSELCGSIAQDKACELGLIVSTTYDPSKHGPHDAAEAGDEWFVFGTALSEAQP